MRSIRVNDTNTIIRFLIIILIESGVRLSTHWRSFPPSLSLSFFPAQSIVVGVEIAVDLVTDRRVQSPVVGHRGTGHARGLLVPLEDPGGSAGPLYQRRILLLGQNVTGRLVARRSGNNSRGRDVIARGLRLTGHRVQMMAGQMHRRHRRGEGHIGMVLRMMIVGLRTVMHVGDLGLIVVAAVRRLGIGVVTLTGVLAVVDRGSRRAPGETVRLAVMDLIHRRRIGRRLQLIRARCQRRRRGRQVAVGPAAAGRRRADSRIRRLRRQKRRRQGRVSRHRRLSALRRRIRRGSSARRRRRARGYPAAGAAVAVILARSRRALRRGGLLLLLLLVLLRLLLHLLSALGPTVLEPDLEQRDERRGRREIAKRFAR